METREQRSMIVTLLVVCVLIAGMLLSQWMVVLYAGMALIGCCLFASLRSPFIPTLIALIYALFFSVMVGVHALQPDLYILGWRPATFVVLYLIWPVALVLGLLYAIWFSKKQSKSDISNQGKGLEG